MNPRHMLSYRLSHSFVKEDGQRSLPFFAYPSLLACYRDYRAIRIKRTCQGTLHLQVILSSQCYRTSFYEIKIELKNISLTLPFFIENFTVTICPCPFKRRLTQTLG